MANFHFVVIILLHSLTYVPYVQATEAAGCSTSWPGWSGIKYMFTFGDSYTQTGFNIGGTQPSPGNPTGNPPYPGWTSCNGPNWVEFLTFKSNASTLLQYNIADGGATVDALLAKPYSPKVHSLLDQINLDFLPKYSKRPAFAPWESNNTLFAFAIGINDGLNTYWNKDRTVVGKIFSEFGEVVEKVYATGARNFLFLSVPPIHRSPLIQTTSPQAITLEEAGVKDWNADLASLSASLTKRHPDATSTVFDTYRVYSAVMDNPAIYPQTKVLKDTTTFCAAYSDGAKAKLKTPAQGCKYVANEYFWLNNLHPTWPVHQVVAEEIGKVLGQKKSNVGQDCARL